MKWITREGPRIDRLACPWLIKRFIDPGAVILYVPFEKVMTAAKKLKAIPFDVPDVEYTHYGIRREMKKVNTRQKVNSIPIPE